jgi:peptide/nickel transport system substrate-binding protein
MYTRYRILLVALLLVAFVIGAKAQEGESGGTLRVGTNAPVNLDPASGSNDPEVLFNTMIYDTLVGVTPNNTVYLSLAREYNVENGLTYVFVLNNSVTFHDGSPLTAADVVYTFNRLKETGSAALSLLGEFEVEARNDTTVVFTLPRHNADFVYGVGSRWSHILKEGTESPNTIVEGDNPYTNFNGTGAFMLIEYLPGERAVFSKNPNYWAEGYPLLDSVEHIYIEDTQAQIDALLTGTVDFIFKVPVDQIATLEAAEGINVLEVATNQHPVIRLRADEGFAGADPLIRQALKLATDRDELNEVLLEGRGVVGNNDPIGPRYGSFYHEDLEKPQYDPEAACALVQEATGEDRISFEFYVVDAFNYADMATLLQQQWSAACIDVEILMRPEGVYYGDNEWMEVELGVTGWGDRPTPQQLLLEAYITDGIYNESHWSNEELDTLVAQAGTIDMEAERADTYAQIAEIFAEEGPIIIPFFAPMIGGASDRVQGLEMNPFPGLTDFRFVSVSE